MTNFLEKPVNPWPSFMIASATDVVLIIAGLVMYQKTGGLLWIVGGVLAGAAVTLPAVLRLSRQLGQQGDTE